MQRSVRRTWSRSVNWNWWWLVVVLMDQASKVMVASFRPNEITINPGVSFGWLPGNTGAVVVSVILIGGIIWWWRTRKELDKTPVTEGRPTGTRPESEQSRQSVWFNLGIQLLLGGAVSNLIDRLLWGGVRDWLPISLTPLSNNLADWAITVGVLLLLFSQVRYHTAQHEKN